MAGKHEVTSVEPQLKLGWDTDDVTGAVKEAEAPRGGAAMLTKPVNRLSKGSPHSPPPTEDTGVEGCSKVKRPL